MILGVDRLSLCAESRKVMLVSPLVTMRSFRLLSHQPI